MRCSLDYSYVSGLKTKLLYFAGLPQCQLSRHIEDRVNHFLQKKAPQVCNGETREVIIRVLCSADKEVDVKPQMKQKCVYDHVV